MINWNQERVMVTGGSGFLGSHVVEELRARGADQIFIPRRVDDYDLTNAGDTALVFAERKPTIVIHLAARCGGIGANVEEPAAMMYETLAMGLNVIEAAREYGGVKRIVNVSSVCAYPNNGPYPLSEATLWHGYPEATNAPYGIAKRTLITLCDAYRRQYNMDTISVIPTNLYGPRDNFDPDRSHVVAGLIRKMVDARDRGDLSVTAWGSGNPTRDLLYVKDAACGIIDAAERYRGTAPVNLASGWEIRISLLASQIAGIVGYKGAITWDRSKPDGQPRRVLDTSRATLEFGWFSRTDLDDGLHKTVRWYEANRRELDR